MGRTRRIVSGLAALVLTACGSSVAFPSLEGGRVETVLSASVIDVGGSVDVECQVFDAKGEAVPSDWIATEVRVSPSEGATVSDHAVSASEVGTYEVACATVDGQLTDDSPAILRVSKDGAVDVETILKDTTVKAGDTIPVNCSLIDAEGQPVEGPTAVGVTPDEGVTVDGADVTFTIVGEYAVACEGAEVPLQDSSPVTVTVIPNDPAVTTANPAVAEAPAGDAVVVACLVEDAWGNDISSASTFVDPQEGLDVQGHTVVGEQAGEYEITCGLDEAPEGLEKVPGLLVITSADPVSMEIVPKPKKNAYAINTKVTLTVVVRDEFGNEIEGLGVSYAMPDDPGIEPKGDDAFLFKAEGAYDFGATLDEPWQAITATTTLFCDESGPEILDLYPPRGETITGDSTMLVHGRAVDGVTPIKKVVINGTDVPVDAEGWFEFGIPSKHGGNHLYLTALDEFNHTTSTTRGWYYSTGWQPADAPMSEAAIDDAAMVFMGQTVLDDGDHDPTHPDDLATIFEVILGGIDFQQLIGSFTDLSFPVPNIVNLNLNIPNTQTGVGVHGDLLIQVLINEITIGSPHVTIDTREGGIAMAAAFAPVEFGLGFYFELSLSASAKIQNPFGGNPWLDWQSNPWSPSVETASSMGAALIALETDFDIEKLPGDAMTVAAKNFHLELQGVDIDALESLIFDFGEIDIPVIGKVDLGQWDLSQFIGNVNDFIGNNLVNPLIDLVTQPLINLLEPLVEGLLGTVIEQVMQLLVLDLPFDIPPLLPGQVDPVTLDLHTEISTVLFTEVGGQIGLNLGLQAEKAIERDPLGSILRDSCAGADPEPAVFSFDAQPEVQIGAKFDFINQALFAVWWGGMLNLDLPLGDLLGGGGTGGLPIDLDGMSITTNFLLPPILNDCGSKGLLEIHVADLYLDAWLTIGAKNHHVGIWLQVRATGGVAAQGNEIGIRIDAINTFEAEIIDITGQLGALLNLVQGFIPQLLNMVAGQEFMFPIPPIDLSIIPGVPAGSELQLGNMAAFNKKGATIIGGDLL